MQTGQQQIRTRKAANQSVLSTQWELLIRSWFYKVHVLKLSIRAERIQMENVTSEPVTEGGKKKINQTNKKEETWKRKTKKKLKTHINKIEISIHTSVVTVSVNT